MTFPHETDIPGMICSGIKERLSEEVWDAVEAPTLWLEANPANFPFLK